MTGGAGAVFQVDGFRGGRLPNRHDIRQVRFRNNSFAADNHDAGRVQVEIITRPGLTAWSGNANLGLRSDVLNARNAFARTETPEQFRRFNMGVRGPLVRNRTSLRINVDGNRSFDSGTIVALTPDGRVADQVRRPFEQTNFSVRLDHGLTTNSTLRLEYRAGEDARAQPRRRQFQPAGARLLAVVQPTSRYAASIQTVLGRATLNELRVQFATRESIADSANHGVSIVVIDAFSRGGAGVSNRRHEAYARGRATTTTSRSASSACASARCSRPATTGTSTPATRPARSRSAASTPSRPAFPTRSRSGSVKWTPRSPSTSSGSTGRTTCGCTASLSVSVGVRQEMQNHVGDHVNPMPRLGFTWNVGGSRTVVRGGYGVFHDWYDSNLHDQTLRVDGVTQRDLLVLNPGYPDPTGGLSSIVLPGGRVQAAPDLKLPYVQQASIGVERPITPTLNVQASVLFMRGRNQMRSRNINAPDAAGVRPEPEHRHGHADRVDRPDRRAIG